MDNKKKEVLDQNITPIEHVVENEQVVENEPEKEIIVETEPVRKNTIVDETGIIAKETKVTGDIATKGHLMIHGAVYGNISANGNVVVNGKVEGEISCKNIKFSDCKAKTNTTVEEHADIGKEAVIEGRITCKRITVEGMLKGDVEAEEVCLYETARVVGSIVAKTLSMEAGAELQGNVRVVK
ncbi:cytoskeletal protein CcmA (bactofilin family) [Clostridiales Family XIII bacterium PM5-7]